jgi:hypothetical protein
LERLPGRDEWPPIHLARRVAASSDAICGILARWAIRGRPMQSPTEDLRRRLEGSNPRSQAAWIAFVFFYAILANLPFWVASRWLGLLPLGWFCLEYAALGVMALFLPRILAATLLVLMIVADLISAVCKTYFLAPAECLANFGSLHEVSPHRLLAVTTVFSLAVIMFAVAANLPNARLPQAASRLSLSSTRPSTASR